MSGGSAKQVGTKIKCQLIKGEQQSIKRIHVCNTYGQG